MKILYGPLFGGGGGNSVPSAPPPPPTINAAANAADTQMHNVDPDQQTYASTLLTGTVDTPESNVKKSALLTGN